LVRHFEVLILRKGGENKEKKFPSHSFVLLEIFKERGIAMKRLVGLFLVMTLSLLVFGCAKKEAEKAEKKEPLKIGAVLSVTGPAAPLGEPEKKTLLMMVEKINQAGGVNGRKLEVIIEDDETDPAKAVAAINKLIDQEKLVAVIGGSTTPSTLAMKEIASKKKIPLVACAAGNAIIASNFEWVFITPQSNAIVVPKVLSYLKEKLRVTDVAFLHDSDAFGQDGLDVFQKEAGKYGVKLVAVEKYEKTQTDLTSQINKLKASKAQALVVWGTNPGPAIARKNMVQLGWKVPYVGSHGIANMKFIELAGKDADGVVFPAGKVLIPESIAADSPQKKVVDEFLADYKAKYNEAPNTFAGHAYDALNLIVEAVKKAGSTESAEIRQALEQLVNVPGIGGVFTYTANDHAGLKVDDLIMIKIEGGKWQLAE